MPDYSGATPAQLASIDQMGAAFREGMRKLRASMDRFGEQIAAFGRALEPLVDSNHGFRPNYDLACTVCGGGPEEHP